MVHCNHLLDSTSYMYVFTVDIFCILYSQDKCGVLRCYTSMLHEQHKINLVSIQVLVYCKIGVQDCTLFTFAHSLSVFSFIAYSFLFLIYLCSANLSFTYLLISPSLPSFRCSHVFLFPLYVRRSAASLDMFYRYFPVDCFFQHTNCTPSQLKLWCPVC